MTTPLAWVVACNWCYSPRGVTCTRRSGRWPMSDCPPHRIRIRDAEAHLAEKANKALVQGRSPGSGT